MRVLFILLFVGFLAFIVGSVAIVGGLKFAAESSKNEVNHSAAPNLTPEQRAMIEALKMQMQR